MKVKSTLVEAGYATVAAGKKPDTRVWVWPAQVRHDGPKISWPEVIVGVREHTFALDPGFLDTRRLNAILSGITGRNSGIGSAQKKYDGLRTAILVGKDDEDPHQFEARVIHAIQSAGYSVIRK